MHKNFIIIAYLFIIFIIRLLSKQSYNSHLAHFLYISFQMQHHYKSSGKFVPVIQKLGKICPNHSYHQLEFIFMTHFLCLPVFIRVAHFPDDVIGYYDNYYVALTRFYVSKNTLYRHFHFIFYNCWLTKNHICFNKDISRTYLFLVRFESICFKLTIQVFLQLPFD